MSIFFENKKKIFKLDTDNSSYVFCISDYGFLEHLYYGEKISDVDIKSVANRQIYTFADMENAQDRRFVASTFLHEYGVSRDGDVRTPACEIYGGTCSKKLHYASHKIYKGKNALENMPSSRENPDVETLEISLLNFDETLEFKLFYSVYGAENVICRHTEIINRSDSDITLSKASSMILDFAESNFSLLTLDGMYLCEKSKVSVRKLQKGTQGIFSLAGTSSHHANPFFALLGENTTENAGVAYGFNLVYSSNFKNEIEVDRIGNTRVVMGINDTGFLWKLKPEERFETPEAIMTYSCEGVGGMSRNFHNHVRNNIVEPKYSGSSRPIVINTWEGAHFNVDEQTVLDFAKKGKSCGVDTVVLDDGWFRNNDTYGLGDWKTVKEKFPSIKNLSEKVHGLGMKFGIWIEPEMVNVGSDLYQKNGKIIATTEPNPLVYRNQFVIDLTNDENVNDVVEKIVREFDGAEIDYIKWDCNKYMSDASSFSTCEGEVFHRQMLGVYKMFEKIKRAFPNALLENCAGGGGRFDLGMLYYAPQIWASDNTDPYERLYIQYGTSVAYPPSSISCHFTEGVCTSGRPSRYDFRYGVASFGPFGYELNLNKYDEKDFERFNEYSKTYRAREKFVLNADLYRIMSPESDTFCAYMQVLKDKSEALLSFFEINTRGFTETMILHLFGLADDKTYRNEQTGEVLSGKAWKNVGVRMNDLFDDETGKGGGVRQILFVEVKQER